MSFTTRRGVLLIVIKLLLVPLVISFRNPTIPKFNTLNPRRFAASLRDGVGSARIFTSLSGQPSSSSQKITPTLADYTRTITHICKSGTLSTICENGRPHGTSVDFVLSQKGHPIFFFSKSATSLSSNPQASFFCKIPHEYEQTSPLSCKSASIQGELVPVTKKEVNSLRIAFSLTHPHCTDSLCRSDDIYFAKLQPNNIQYSTGDFGVKPITINVEDYENTFPDILAQEVPRLLPRLNIEKQYELRLLCKHILKIPEDVKKVVLQAIDKLGIDIQTIREGNLKEEYRVAFRHPVNSAEDAKSELIKLFQECYVQEHGKTGFKPSEPPVVVKYA